MNLVDSSGWIEFFQAGGNGPVFKPVIEDRNSLLVPTIALFEVHKVLSRRLAADLVERCLNVMRLFSQIYMMRIFLPLVWEMTDGVFAVFHF